MGVLRLFVDLAGVLAADPTRSTQSNLDGLFDVNVPFSYIGNRKTLSDLVFNISIRIREKLLELDAAELVALSTADSDLAQKISRLRKRLAQTDLAPDEVAQVLYSSSWNKNSGKYPDFILAWQKGQLGDGAILELKDAENDAIASFNSTLPMRAKSLEQVEALNKMAVQSARLYDLPFSLKADYDGVERACFYFIRTRKNNANRVKLSLVEGSFFETLPRKQLFHAIWSQLLERTRLSEHQKAQAVDALSELEQEEIVQSREIENAAIKPRLRLMAETHEEGNPHNYSEIAPRTLNLIFKRPEKYDSRWLEQLFIAEGLERIQRVDNADGQHLQLMHQGRLLRFRILSILHKRNGEHIALQYALPR